MSIRWIGTRLFRHGQAYVRGLCRQYNTSNNIAEAVKGGVAGLTGLSQGARQVPSSGGFALRNVGVQVSVHARRILIDNVLSRVTNTLAADLRRKAAKRLLYGDSGTFLAFVGVSLASGTGILTKEEELEGVCYEIRDAISKIKWNFHDVDPNVSRLFENEPISLDDLTLGRIIDKGSNAAVYTAKINDGQLTKPAGERQIIEPEDSTESSESFQSNNEQLKMDDVEFPFAVKMMFNYDIQSSAMAILKGMYRETIPARVYYSNTGEINDWELSFSERQRHLPAHPNIVAMFSVFTGYMPNLTGAATMYPAALPRRLNTDGFGRNMTLFLLMQRYTCTLHTYLRQQDSVNIRHSVILLAQLLEGIVHLFANGISHRDLKADNLLVDVLDPESPPQLVISDFGCCLAEKSGSLVVPFNSDQVEKGGNGALMAPEIECAQPGSFSSLNYARSDLWACGTIAYELFGCPNPFYYRKSSGQREGTEERTKRPLTKANYNTADVPELPSDVPPIVRLLVRSCLERKPNKRLDPEIAANVMQLHLWAPSSWLKPGLTKLPSSAEILQWLLTLTTKVLCESRQQTSPVTSINGGGDSFPGLAHPSNVKFKNGRRTYPEYLLISAFLSRAKLYKIKSALKFIQISLNDM